MANIHQEVDFSNLGLKIYDCWSGETLQSADYYSDTASGTLRFKIKMSNPLLAVDSKIGVCIDIDSDTYLVTVAEVKKLEKTPDFYYLYTLDVEGVGAVTSNVVTYSGSTHADISRVRLLDYDHAWEKSELQDGTRGYQEYFFDNTSVTNSAGANTFDGSTVYGLEQRRLFYTGRLSPDYTGTMFHSITYPIIDFFHDEFIHVIENKALVWMRRKSGGGLDTLTWAGKDTKNNVAYITRNPRSAETDTIGGKQTVIPDTEYVIQVARPKSTITTILNQVIHVKDRTESQRTSDVYMQPTMAKFIGWPTGGFNQAGSTAVYSNCQPFYFLKPAQDYDGNDLSTWENDSAEVYPKPSFYFNGAHAIPSLTINNKKATGAVQLEGRFYRWTTVSPSAVLQYMGYEYCWTPNAQEVAGFGAKFIPGDGNEFYNCKFWRNDGDSYSPPVTLDSRQGIVFDNCDFLSTWDGYSDNYTGSTEISEALVITNDSYDNTFINCKFELKTVQKEVIWDHYMTKNGAANDYCELHFYRADNMIFGKREKRDAGSALYDAGLVSTTSITGGKPVGDQKIGYTSAVRVEQSGNIKFDGCYFKTNYAQDCLVASNADNIEIVGCSAETYYHNTEVLLNKHCDSNISTFDLNSYYQAQITYEGVLTLYEVFIKMFGSEMVIKDAYSYGDVLYDNYRNGTFYRANPYMNGIKMKIDWNTISAANTAVTNKTSASANFEALTDQMVFKITDKYELKPKGFWFKDQTTSILVKGTSFYGEGIGFFTSDSTNSHYLEFENNRVDTYIDEAYLFRNVKYPKLRGCWGHTISHTVYKFESCIKPVQYDCTAESDTGFGFEYVRGSATTELAVPFATDMWRVYDCHVLSGSGLEYDPTSMPAKIDFGTFIQTANSTQDTYVLPEASGIERSLVGIKLYDAPYKATFRNVYFRNIKNDIDIYKGDNVELYLENAHFSANREIHGTYSSPAYFIHKGFSGVWEYRDIGGSITTSAVYKEKNINMIDDTYAGFSLSFKSHIDNPLGRSTVVLGNSNDETQYLDLVQGPNKIEVYLMGRLLDVEKPLTNQDIWLELRYKDRAPGDPHVITATSRGSYTNIKRIEEDVDHRSAWRIKGELVPNATEYKITMIINAGQDCSCPLSICYEYFTTVGEIYVDPYARVVQLDDEGQEI